MSTSAIFTAQAESGGSSEGYTRITYGGGTMTASQVQRIRGKLRLSQPKFAALLGISVRTLQGWEQGRYEPNAAAVALLKLAESGALKKKR
jgi:putative transcriptional regulator